ncbi:hypothetical protein AMS68_003343 [Peltaster fructicola]|uniref:Uncharacterized protein n=1 Tax=Peltaster fructicola TaxID=286661 RepID=A0A6H0XT20_9PEZI|nr:hypothetical protein AMS68_003343 [Peltaster fructicola]
MLLRSPQAPDIKYALCYLQQKSVEAIALVLKSCSWQDSHDECGGIIDKADDDGFMEVIRGHPQGLTHKRRDDASSKCAEQAGIKAPTNALQKTSDTAMESFMTSLLEQQEHVRHLPGCRV